MRSTRTFLGASGAVAGSNWRPPAWRRPCSCVTPAARGRAEEALPYTGAPRAPRRARGRRRRRGAARQAPGARGRGFRRRACRDRRGRCLHRARAGAREEAVELAEYALRRRSLRRDPPDGLATAMLPKSSDGADGFPQRLEAAFDRCGRIGTTTRCLPFNGEVRAPAEVPPPFTMTRLRFIMLGAEKERRYRTQSCSSRAPQSMWNW